MIIEKSEHTVSKAKTGVVLVNLGSPEQATQKSVKRFLAEFLSDQRVVDLNRWIWLPLLHGLVIPRRTSIILKKYQSIWMNDGSPLWVLSQRIQQKLQEQLAEGFSVELAMRYGTASVKKAIDRLLQQQVTKLVILPLYPQFSMTTTGTVWDALSIAFYKQPSPPEIRFVGDYAVNPAYIAALVSSIKHSFSCYGQPEKLIFSYHGLPLRYVESGDPYYNRCLLTTQAVVQLLKLSTEQYCISWQSRFGKEPWLTPNTETTLIKLAQQGVKHVQVICPGFAVDCLETLDEIAKEGEKQFLLAGGTKYHYIAALNDSELQINLMIQLITS